MTPSTATSPWRSAAIHRDSTRLCIERKLHNPLIERLRDAVWAAVDRLREEPPQR
ncbi:hypothetical protein [Candidatus Amarolinea dominans]|uniref:hypothetical protein n=1 Tax=Candidatus Amarolinea dominans TaxID=3140696 RepID=UPI001DDDAC69|nr:hypothetical protein [Anaerolineae bacterium]